MSDLDGGSPAPADTAPIVHEATPPNPVSTEGQAQPEPTRGEPSKAPAKDQAKPEPTPRDALKRAAERVEKDNRPDDKPKPVEGAAKVPAKVETKSEPEAQPRGEGGKFATKAPAEGQDGQQAAQTADGAGKADTGIHEAPARFSSEAKAAWASTPDPVKAETARAIRENEAGIQKYRESAEAFEQVRKYHDTAKANGTTLDRALERMVGVEKAWQKDPVDGMLAICREMRIDPAQLVQAAAQRLGGMPRQVGDSPELAQLRAENANLKRQMQTVQEKELSTEIETFAKDRPRFDELKATVGRLLQNGTADTLHEAYEMADRLKPAAQPEASAAGPQTASVTARPQTAAAPNDRGTKSITGAPSDGSNPIRKPASTSPRDAVRRAFAAAG